MSADSPVHSRRAPELIEEEVIVDHGAQRTEWFVRLGASWLPASRVPGARSEALPTGPGIVWRRSVHLLLPAGAELMRVNSGPARWLRRDAFAYLSRETRGPERSVRRHYFCVDPCGELISKV